jgi:hypothetical protein
VAAAVCDHLVARAVAHTVLADLLSPRSDASSEAFDSLGLGSVATSARTSDSSPRFHDAELSMGGLDDDRSSSDDRLTVAGRLEGQGGATPRWAPGELPGGHSPSASSASSAFSPRAFDPEPHSVPGDDGWGRGRKAEAGSGAGRVTRFTGSDFIGSAIPCSVPLEVQLCVY